MKLLKLKDVMEKTTMSRSTIYLRIKQGDFPKPFKLGGGETSARSARWTDKQIDDWIEVQIEAGE